MNKEIIILLGIIGVIFASGCVQTGEIISKDVDSFEEDNQQSSKYTNIEENDAEKSIPRLSCSDAGFIIRGMSYEGNSIAIELTNTGLMDLTINAMIKYLDGDFESFKSIGQLKVGDDFKGMAIYDVNSDIDVVYLTTRECFDAQDYITRKHIVGLTDSDWIYDSECDDCYSGIVNKIVDGDTIHVDDYVIRLSLVDSPESDESGFSTAKEFTEDLCPVGTLALIDIDDMQVKDKYDRYVAVVYCNGKNLNEELLESGNAAIYAYYCTRSEFEYEDWAQRFGCEYPVYDFDIGSVPQQRSQEICNDRYDNDGDGYVDCIDWDCACSTSCAENCYDGYDNDGDGYIDLNDWYCDWHCR